MKTRPTAPEAGLEIWIVNVTCLTSMLMVGYGKGDGLSRLLSWCIIVAYGGWNTKLD